MGDKGGGGGRVSVARLLGALFGYFLRPEGWLSRLCLAASFALAVSIRVVNILSPLVLKAAVSDISHYCQGTSSYLPYSGVIWYAVLFALKNGANNGLLPYLWFVIWTRVDKEGLARIQTDALRTFMRHPLSWHDSQDLGHVLAVMGKSQLSSSKITRIVIFDILPTLVDALVAITYFAHSFDAVFGLLVGVSVVVFLCPTYLITNFSNRYRRAANAADNRAKATLADILGHIFTVKVCGAEHHLERKWFCKLKELFRQNFLENVVMSAMKVHQAFTVAATILIGSVLCLWRVREGVFDESHFVMFISYVRQLFIPLGLFGTYIQQVQEGFINVELLFQLMNDNLASAPKRESVISGDTTASVDSVSAEGVKFSYPEKPSDTFSYQFRAKRGELVAISGESGSGKSTFIKLLLGLVNPTEGWICYGDAFTNLSGVRTSRFLSVAGPSASFLTASVRENLLLGNDSSLSDDDLLRLAEVADAATQIRDLPHGLDTVVDQNVLSHGQMARLVLARAVARRAEVLLVDEFGAHLDAAHSRLIARNLRALASSGRVCVVLVCHDPDSVLQGVPVDRLYRMQQHSLQLVTNNTVSHREK